MKQHLKQLILRIEQSTFQIAPTRIVVWAISTIVHRLFWLWGRVRFGALISNKDLGCVCHWNVDLKYPQNIKLGSKVIIGTNASIGAHSTVTIDSNVRISRDVIIETAGLDFKTKAPPYLHISKPIHIEEGVWIGARAMILGGVTIGKNSIVAAGAIVTKSFPNNSIVAGAPAKLLRTNTKD